MLTDVERNKVDTGLSKGPVMWRQAKIQDDPLGFA